MPGIPDLLPVNVGPAFAGAYNAGRQNVRADEALDMEREQAAFQRQEALKADARANAAAGRADREFNFQQAKAISDLVRDGALGADTPEKWAGYIGLLEKHFGKDLSNFRDFNTRSSLIATGKQAAPDLVELFDEKTGQPYKATWNPASRSYDRVGGTKGVQDQAPHIVELFDDETGQPYKAQWNATTKSFDRVGGIKAPSGTSLQVDPQTGAVTFQQGAGVKPLTEGQSKDTVFATRASGAAPLVDQYGGHLTDWTQQMAGNAPFGWGKFYQSPEYQKGEQAGKEFLQAILRKDTGAAITKEETAEYGSVYLPQPGDKPELLEQKRQSRERAVAALKAGMPPQAILQMEKALQTGPGAPRPPVPRGGPAVPPAVPRAPAAPQAPAASGPVFDWSPSTGLRPAQ